LAYKGLNHLRGVNAKHNLSIPQKRTANLELLIANLVYSS